MTVKEEIKPKTKKIKEPWVKARFEWVEMAEYPGSTWKCNIQGKLYKFTDGELYELPFELVDKLLGNCKVVKRTLKKSKNVEGELGKLVKTKAYQKRINFLIEEKFDKEKIVKVEE